MRRRATLAQTYDNELGAALQAIMASGEASIDYISTYAMLDAAVANPAAYGFTNVTQPVWNGNLTYGSSGTLNATGAAQNGYLFFDDLHPTAAGHALLATGVKHSLTGTALNSRPCLCRESLDVGHFGSPVLLATKVHSATFC